MMNGNISGTPPSFIFQGRHSESTSSCFGFKASALEGSMGKSTATASTCPDHLMSEKEDLDKYLAQSMTTLSVKNREAALEEVNGIASSQPEDPDTLELCLQEFNEHLMQLKRGTYYEVAEKMDSDYVRDRDFRIMFLRANRYSSNGQHRYDPKRAAEQMKNFFDTKHLLFGKDKLVKEITLDDLDEDDKRSFQRGSIQVLPVRDTAGRLVFVNIGGLSHFKSIESELRAKFYMFMSLKNVEGVQEKGIVSIRYCVGQYRDEKSDSNSLALHGQCVSSFPYHWAGVQVCCDDYRQYILLRTILMFFPTDFAARVRVHFGTHLECLYALRAYGIPEGSIPLSTTNGELMHHHHALWYKQQCIRDMARTRKQSILSTGIDVEQKVAGISERFDDEFLLGFGSGDLESDEFSIEEAFEDLGNDLKWQSEKVLLPQLTQQASSMPVTPRPTDILFGQNHKMHPGNVRLHGFISKHADEYERIGGRQRKIEFAGHLVLRLKAAGARFLQLDKSSMQWMEVSDTKARNKVAKTIRNRRRNMIVSLP
eukprot:scaffold6821_cov127-Cylindrotheca_fusiformis.AAC.5